jgi:GDPmannose 4,6-dehydratase
VKVDPRYFRPTEVNALRGDPSRARTKLGWKHKVTFDDLVTEMVSEDLRALRTGGQLVRHLADRIVGVPGPLSLMRYL